MNKIINRVKEWIDFKGINMSMLERACGVSNGYIGKMNRRNADIGESILIKILENNPEINMRWLITGEGEMLNREIPKDPKDAEIIELLKENNKLLQQKNESLEKEVERLKGLYICP